jgi:hypothetical protein
MPQRFCNNIQKLHKSSNSFDSNLDPYLQQQRPLFFPTEGQRNRRAVPAATDLALATFVSFIHFHPLSSASPTLIFSLPEFRASLKDFFKGFCGDHAENNLAIFGFILDVKVGKKKPFYILDYQLLELIIKIWRFEISFPLKSG